MKIRTLLDSRRLAGRTARIGEIKPASGLEFGFEAWLMAVSTRREPIVALRIKPTKKTANKKVSARERSVRSGK